MTASLPALVDPGPDLREDQRQRYARQLLLPGIGVLGQRRLCNARVLVVGAGGLGSPVLLYLAAAGVGTIGVIDDDAVDVTNLHRQVLHGVPDVGRPKVDSATEALAALNPNVTVRAHRERLTSANALDVLAGYELVVDGADNFATRYLVADACEVLGLPCVWGSILRFEGHVSVFWPGRGPGYRDIFPDPPDPESAPSCAEAGVFGSLCGTIGSVLAGEVIKLVTGTGRPLIGRLLVHDALGATWRELRVRPDPRRTPVHDLAADYEQMCGLVPAEPVPSVSAAELAALMRAGEALLVDVREDLEVAGDRITGSTHLPMDQILSGAAMLDRGVPIVVHCASGVRSARVVAHLAGLGYQARHLDGGLDAWRREYPIDPV